MKKNLLFAWLLGWSAMFCGSSFAQNITLLDGSQTTVSDCNGLLIDSGGYGNYSNAENYTLTISPPNSGCMSFTLDTLNIQTSAAFTLYDGIGTTGTVLARFTSAQNTTISQQYLAPSGSVTVVFLSNLSGPVSSGFVARWACAADCSGVAPCSATVYDNGGRDSMYLANRRDTITYCPNRQYHRVRLDINDIDIVAGDQLCIYDGNSPSAPLLVCLDNSLNGGSAGGAYFAEATNTSGCLTLVFNSDANSEGNGYNANLSCFKPCQRIVPDLLLNTVVPTYPTVVGDSAVNICKGQAITVSANVSFPENNTTYPQNDNTTLYWVSWGDGSPLTRMTSGASHTATHNYNGNGIFFTAILASDPDSLCAAASLQRLRTRVIDKFAYRINSPSPICLGNSATLTLGTQTNTTVGYDLPATISGFNGTGTLVLPLCIPDPNTGNGVSLPLVNTLLVNNLSGSVVDATSIKYIYVNMQHSYAGDLDIQLICPDGHAVELKSQTVNGGNGIFLGIANDNSSICTEPAQGLYYAWLGNTTFTQPNFSALQPLTYECPLGSPNAYTMGFFNNVTMNQAFLLGTPVYISTLCNPYIAATTPNTLKPGFYQPFESLDSLNGCPLNGSWSLQITDRLGADNGIVYEWGIVFNPNLIPNIETYLPILDSITWVCNPTVVSPCLPPTNNITVSPTQTGTFTYNVRAHIAGFPNCGLDTLVKLNVKPLPQSGLTNQTVCPQGTVVLNGGVGCIGASTYTASGGAITINPSGNASPFPSTIQVNIPGNCTYKIGRVQLNGITHTWPNDIDMWLTGPFGQSVILMSDVGSSTDFTPNTNLNIQMGAPPMTGVTPIANGTYAPTDITPGDAGIPTNASTNLGVFTGNVNGVWSLHIIDDVGGDAGALASWGITFVSESGLSYTWNTGANTPTTVVGAGTYTVTIVDIATACTTSSSAAVSIDAAGISIASTPTVANTQTGSASATTCVPSTGTTYAWSNGGSTPTITGLGGGVYTVTVTTANGTTYTASTTVGIISSITNSDSFIRDFTIQPNPSDGNITLNANFETATISTISIHNVMGQLLLSQNNAATTTLQIPIEGSNLAAGVYLLTLRTPNGQETRKMVVGN
jgi:subtilisin-like proprotein convertase family protein